MLSTTLRFQILRSRQLKKIIQSSRLIDLWRKQVKTILRGQDILDLHDYFDFNLNIKQRAREIEADVVSGKYRPSPAVNYRLEKKHGICRHMCLPAPSDAIVFQLLTNHLEKRILKTAPTTNALYSRAHSLHKLPHEIESYDDEPWFKKWIRFQKTIWNFSKEKKFLIVTDLTNYFDSIALRDLRNVVASRVKSDEVVLDLLFRVIEGMKWNPDYLPSNSTGLPTINIDAPRLLAHTYLFETDSVLQKLSGKSFIRWMDDINIGADNEHEARSILSELSDVLKSRGLALNISKTSILSSQQVEYQFLVNENQLLDKLNAKKEPNKKDKAKFRSAYSKIRKDRNSRNWTKIAKRFISLSEKFEFSKIEEDIPQFFIQYPDLRGKILNYLEGRIPDKGVLKIWEQLNEPKYLDDTTKFQLANLLTKWELPFDAHSRRLIKKYFKNSSDPSTFSNFYSGLWVRSKYESPNELFSYINSNRKLWAHHRFLTRQCVAASGRLFTWDLEFAKRNIRSHADSAHRDASSVASNLLSLSETPVLQSNVLLYVFPHNGHEKYYPLAKYLILTAILSSPGAKNHPKVLSGIKDYITDPWYRHWINEFAPDFKNSLGP